MNISGPTNNYVHTSYTKQANPATSNLQAKTAGPPKETKTDNIDLSEKTRDLQRISQSMETEPADRTQLVSDIKDQIRANQYTINAENIAQKMIGAIFYEQG